MGRRCYWTLAARTTGKSIWKTVSFWWKNLDYWTYWYGTYGTSPSRIGWCFSIGSSSSDLNINKKVKWNNSITNWWIANVVGKSIQDKNKPKGPSIRISNIELLKRKDVKSVIRSSKIEDNKQRAAKNDKWTSKQDIIKVKCAMNEVNWINE